MHRTRRLLVSLLVLASAAFLNTFAVAAPLAPTDADNLATVSETLELARYCQLPAGKYAELSKFVTLSRKVQVEVHGVAAADVEHALQQGKARAQRRAATFDCSKCLATVEQLNPTFANLNSMLQSLAGFSQAVSPSR